MRIPWIESLNPNGRRRFNLFHNFGRDMIFGLREQDVDMVPHRIDLDERRIVIFERTGDVGVELPAFRIAQELVAEFGAEHEVHDDVGEGLGHSCDALTGL